MDTHFICLANSYKRGGRCVAGVEINIDANDCWTVKRKADGNPIWIRPISKDTEFGEIPEGEAHHVPLMSVVRLTDVVACPSESHTEDVNYGSMHAIGKVPSCHVVLRELTDNVHTTLFYSTEYSISIETYVQGDYSLMMVHPEGFSFRLDPTKNRAKYYMIFQYNDVTYDFSITDPAFYQYISQYPEAMRDAKHPAWVKNRSRNDFYWEEPLFGYYMTTDTWVLRKHAELLADAGVDAIFTDCTNGSQTWDESTDSLLYTWKQAKLDGVKVPKIVFFLPFRMN